MLEWLYEVRGKVLTHEYLVLLATVSFAPYLLACLRACLLACMLACLRACLLARHCVMGDWWACGGHVVDVASRDIIIQAMLMRAFYPAFSV